MLRLFLTVLLAFVPCATLAADLREVRMADGRSYLFAMPEGQPGAPLIIALHGGGGNPAQFARSSGLADDALEAGFAVAFPAGTSRWGGRLLVWNGLYCCGYAPAAGIDDLGFLDRVAADAGRRFGTGKVFVTGMSNGAILAQTWAATRPGTVAAVASVAGTMDVAQVRVAGPVPLLHIHGTQDTHVLYEGGSGPDSFVDTDFSSVRSAVAAFRAPHGAMAQRRSVIDPARDGTRVEVTAWEKSGRDRVVLMTVVGGGHDWPGGRRARDGTRDIRANDEVLRFFAAWRS